MVRWRGADGQWHDTREGQARGFRAYQPELPRGTKLDKYWQKEVDGWRLPPKGWAAFGGTDNSHIPYRQREEKMPDGFSGTLGAEPFQNMVEPLVLRLLTDHWPELSYEQILTLSEAGRAELWWHQGPGPKPEPPPGWDEEAHHGMPLDGALYTIGKRWVQLYDMARKHPWVLGPLQRRPEIGEWVRGHTTWLPDGAFDPDHPVLRKIPVVRSFRGWKGWRAGPRIDLQPPHRPWSAADHVPPRDRVEWSTPRQDRDVARWDAVQRWADRVIGEFADDTGNADVHRIVDLLTRARDPLLDPADPGGARLETLNLARHPDGTALTRAELTERIQLVKDHLMRNEMWVRDHADPTGRMVKKTYDRLPHVADAWLRLTGEGDGDGRTTPYNEDLLLLDDAYVEARYLADHDDATWHDADLEAARYGYDWDTNRRRLSGHLVIRDGVPVHPDELPPDAPEHDGDKTLRMSRIPYAVDAPAPDPSWLSPRERRAAEILAETDARQRFPGLPRNPVEALKEVAAREEGPLRALPAPGARDPLLDLLLRAGRVEQLADADPGEHFVWAERLGEPEAAVEPRQLPDTLRRLRGDLTRRLDDLGAAGPDEQAGEANRARPASGDGPLRQPGPMEPHELTSGRTEVERLATERARLADDLGRLRAERDAATGSERERAARAYEEVRTRVFALTERITDAAAPDFLAAQGARPVTNRVGIIEGDHPIVIVVGLRSDGSGGSPHRAELDAAVDAHPELAQALAHPDAEIRYIRLTVDSQGRAFVAALEAPPQAPRPQQPGSESTPPVAESNAHRIPPATEETGAAPQRPDQQAPADPPPGEAGAEQGGSAKNSANQANTPSLAVDGGRRESGGAGGVDSAPRAPRGADGAAETGGDEPPGADGEIKTGLVEPRGADGAVGGEHRELGAADGVLDEAESRPNEDDTEAGKPGTGEAPEGSRSTPGRADDGGERPVAPVRPGIPSEGEGSEPDTARGSSGDADAGESGEKGESPGDRAEEPRTTQPHGGGRRASGSDGDGTDSESEDGTGTGRRAGQEPPDGGEPDRAGGANPRARDPRKPYITPVPHVPHNAEFEWPDYTPKRIDVNLPPAPIPTPPPHQPPPPPHQPPHQPPRMPGPGQPGVGHHDPDGGHHDQHGHDPDHHGDHRGYGHGHDHGHHGHDGNDHGHGGHDHGNHGHDHHHDGHGHNGDHEHGGHEDCDHHHHDHDHHLPGSQAQPSIPVPPWLSDSSAPGNAAPQPFPLPGAGIERNVNPAGTGLNPFGDPLGAIPHMSEPAVPQQLPPQSAPEPRVSDGPPAAIPPDHGVGQGPGGADRYGAGYGNGNGHGTGYDPGAGYGNVHDRRFSVDRPFSLDDPAVGATGHLGVQPVPAAQPQNDFPQNGFPPFAPPMPHGKNAASASTPARHPAHPTGSPTPAAPRILVQEFNGHRCAKVDPLTGSLHEAAEPMGPFSGVYGDLDGVEFVFFRTDDRLFLRVAGQLIDADDLAVIVHWQRAGRRHTDFTVTRAGLAVCTVRYRQRKPELDLGLWIRDVLDNPARRTQIFAEVRGVR
jgi:hypothetical protein